MKSPARKITRIYIIALMAIGALTISSQLLIRYVLKSQSADGRVINISGRQRMLSQKLTKASLFIYQSTTPEAYQRRKEELQAVVDLWEHSHNALQNGNPEMEIPKGYNSDEIKKLFLKISPHFLAMKQAANHILMQSFETPKEALDKPLARIAENEVLFLPLMNTITFQYDAEAQEKIATLEQIELILMCVTLLVLLLEAILIFRPAINKIEVYFQQTQEANKILSYKNEQLHEAQEQMKGYISELDDAQMEMKAQLEELQASEEEIRQNAEELHAVNESLVTAKNQIEQVLSKEQEANKKLFETMDALKTTQQHLIHTEKMSSLGVLTAGVAHEINNPINFVYAGSNALNILVEDLFGLMKQYECIKPNDSYEKIKEVLAAVEEKKKEVYYHEVEDDVKMLIKDITTGAERTQKIVKSLSVFSRSNKANEAEPADLKENLDAVLTLLNNQLGKEVQIVKEYEESLPMVSCYASQINQVFISLISNARQAIKQTGKIILKLWATTDRNHVFFMIEDSGAGISSEHLSQIFDPFFTTKDVGSGTGLGLSMVHGIIDNHHGAINVESELGKGTTVIVKLPIVQQD